MILLYMVVIILFTINVANNTSGSSRSATIVIEKYNTRVTGVSSQTLTINQSA